MTLGSKRKQTHMVDYFAVESCHPTKKTLRLLQSQNGANASVGMSTAAMEEPVEDNEDSTDEICASGSPYANRDCHIEADLVENKTSDSSKSSSDHDASDGDDEGQLPQVAQAVAGEDQCSELPPRQKLRRKVAAQKQAAQMDKRLSQLGTDLTAAITEQRGKLPLADPEADRQHRIEWQDKHVPRIHLVHQAGYKTLGDKLSNWKLATAALSKQPASSRRLLADSLGWDCTPDVRPSVSAEKIGKKLTGIIKVHLAKLSSRECRRQGWKLNQIPRKSALEKAGHAEVYRQIAHYQHSILGPGGRERLAAELDWTLAGCSGKVTTPREAQQASGGVPSLVKAKLLEREEAAAQKKALEHEQYLKDIERKLTCAISEQRAKLPLDDAALDAQHRQDWQSNVLPRAWALKQAGYLKLFREMQNYKRRVGRNGVNRDLLAEDLGWLKATACQEKSDAALIGQRLEEVIHKQQIIAPENSEWQSKLMPRTTALKNAGFPLLAQQVQNFRKSYYGGQGREWLAKELGWTLADRLHPQYSLQELREELSKAIARQQDALDRHDPDWLKQHVPRWKALKDVGLDALAAQVNNFRAESPSEDGRLLVGRTGLAEALGWSLAEAKREQRVEAEQIAQRLEDVIKKQRALLGADSAEWQARHVPREQALRAAGYKRLASTVSNYNREAQGVDRGRTGLAQRMGWRLIPSPFAEPGTWQGWEACATTAKKLMMADRRFSDVNKTPSKQWFVDHGYGGLVAAACWYFPAEHGGWPQFMNLCGRRTLRSNNGARQPQQIEARLRAYLVASGQPLLMPTQRELQDISSDWDHPLHDYARGVAVAINKSGVSWAEFARRLGIKPRRNEFVTEEEHDLLESILEQLPCGNWQTICELYNAQRMSLSQRTASSLEHLLQRAQRSSLQLLQCARGFALKTTKDISKLRAVLQRNQVLDDLPVLQSLFQHIAVCKRLAKVAETDVLDLLLVLPGKLGSESWLQGIHEQLEIEGQVHFWQRSQQQIRRTLTMAQVWDTTAALQPFKDQRLALSLENSRLVAALQSMVQQAMETRSSPTAAATAAAAHDCQLQTAFFSRTVAFSLVQQLPESACVMPLIQTVPLVQRGSPLQTLNAFQYDPADLPLLPLHLQTLYLTGRLAGAATPQWSKFWSMDFASTQGLRQAAGARPGIYQIFLCRYNTDDKGQRTLLTRTEWYNGAASIALVGRIADYLPLSKCGHPGPHEEITKRCLFWAACEHGFQFEIRFLKLDGMNPAEVYQAEAHYLQFKWPLNKQQNCGIRVNPPLRLLSRLAIPNEELMQPRIDSYPRNSMHVQGLAQLHAYMATVSEAEVELHEALDDEADSESDFCTDWEDASSGDASSGDEMATSEDIGSLPSDAASE